MAIRILVGTTMCALAPTAFFNLLAESGNTTISEATWVPLGLLFGAIGMTAFLVSKWGKLVARQDNLSNLAADHKSQLQKIENSQKRMEEQLNTIGNRLDSLPCDKHLTQLERLVSRKPKE